MNCPQCHTKVPDAFSFCPQCGTNVRISRSEGKALDKVNLVLIGLLVVNVVISVFVIGGIIQKKRTEPETSAVEMLPEETTAPSEETAAETQAATKKITSRPQQQVIVYESEEPSTSPADYYARLGAMPFEIEEGEDAFLPAELYTRADNHDGAAHGSHLRAPDFARKRLGCEDTTVGGTHGR